MEWRGQAAAATEALLDQYGVLAIALCILVEEAGVPIPLPGDALMLSPACVHVRARAPSG